MTITRATIWEAYRELEWYAWTRGLSTTPRGLSNFIRYPDEASAQRLAERADTFLGTHPLQLDPETYAYVFLFAQWVRVSMRATPQYLGPVDGWVNLQWVPLRILAGRKDDPSGVDGAWKRVHYELRRQTAEEIAQVYPRVADPAVRLPAVLRVSLEGAANRGGGWVGVCKTLYDDEPSRWHPWLLVGSSAAWSYISVTNPTRRMMMQTVPALLTCGPALRLFKEVAWPILPTAPVGPIVKGWEGAVRAKVAQVGKGKDRALEHAWPKMRAWLVKH